MGLDMYLYGEKYLQDWEYKYKDGIIPDDTEAKKVQSLIGIDFPVS